ncbi:NUDIX domain protein [Streptomyces sp. YIM 121038]|uniref:NUDIX domain-containing protein n=1 Tax=Streptomyces sp. YIM 121038 TaxID=2136401 RepID=UPI0011627979|nr:NUDIX domain-containing protein [Streptomyces sp. YIM 121038]QCX75742.1 NUDIX domain protein [Streptomyces sp. YIM 121038]
MHNEVHPSTPFRRIDAAAIIHDGEGRVLLMGPADTPAMVLPGGAANANEYPHIAVQRQVREKSGLVVSPNRALAVDYTPENEEDTLCEGITFVFDCGRVDSATNLPPYGEGFAWVARTDLANHAGPYTERLTRAALRARETGAKPYLMRGFAVFRDGVASDIP